MRCWNGYENELNLKARELLRSKGIETMDGCLMSIEPACIEGVNIHRHICGVNELCEQYWTNINVT
jgi:hypothetical protein